jgi:hypothetical protein
MKKIMSLMLGLSLAFGTVVFAADEKPASGEKKTAKKKGAKKGAKAGETGSGTTPATPATPASPAKK